MAGDALNALGFYHYRLSKNKPLTPENIFIYSYYTLAKRGGFSVSKIVAMLNAISKDLGAKEIKLRHSKTRLYGIAPNKKHDEIDVALKDISIDIKYFAGAHLSS